MDCTRQVDVPDEILVEIFSHLKNGFTAEVEALRQRRQCEKRRSSWQDLLSLEIGVARALHHTFHAVCLTSRQFRRTAQPLLYESVPMCTVRCWRDSNTLREYDGFEQQAQLLLRTLSENPDLRERVRTLRWDFFGWFEHKVHRNDSRTWLEYLREYYLDCMQQSRDPINDMTGFSEAFSGLFHQPREHKLYHIKELALFLIMFPKIKILVLGGLGSHDRCEESEDLLRRIFESAAKFLASHTDEEIKKSTHPLLQLQELHLLPHSIQVPLFMFLHPGVTTFYFDGYCLDNSELSGLKWPPLKRLRHIRCRRCEVTTIIVRKFIVNCPGLETLRLHWLAWVFCPPRLSPSMDYNNIGRHLRQFQRNLKVLQLQESINESSFRKRSTFTGRIGSLRELSQLVELTIDYVYFVVDNTFPEYDILPLVDVIPSSLEILELYGCTDADCVTEEGLRNDLLALLASKNASKLRKVRVHRPSRDNTDGDVPKTLEFDSTFGPDLYICGWDMKQTDDDYFFTRL